MPDENVDPTFSLLFPHAMLRPISFVCAAPFLPSLQSSPIVPDTAHSVPSSCLLQGRRRTVGVDAAAEHFVAVLPVQAFRDAVAHVPVKFRAQLGNGQEALVIARRAFQHHGGPEAVFLQAFQTVTGHVINEDMMPVI